MVFKDKMRTQDLTPVLRRDWLLVDDVVDTGTTLKAVREILPHAHFVSLRGDEYSQYCQADAQDLYFTGICSLCD